MSAFSRSWKGSFSFSWQGRHWKGPVCAGRCRRHWQGSVRLSWQGRYWQGPVWLGWQGWQVGHGVGEREGAHGPFDGAVGDDPARCIDVRLFHGVQNVVHADGTRGHAVGVEQHLELSEVAAETLHRRDAGDRQEPVVDFELHEIAQGHQVGGAGVGF